MSGKRAISIEELEIGQTLPGNILDAEEKVVFRQGLKLTPQIVEVWKRRGGGPYFLADSTLPAESINSAPASAPTPKPEPMPMPKTPSSVDGHYDSGQCTRIAEWFEKTQVELETLVDKLAIDETPSLRALEASLENAPGLWENDSAPVIYHIITDDRNHGDSPSLARRCCYMAALAGVVAQEHGLDHEDCYKVCLAGMLHDLALFPPLLTKLQDSFDTAEEKQAVITRHAFMTTDLLSARLSIPDMVRVIINQVHEQVDGRGYPRGIPGHFVSTMARVLNLSDAFLTMIGAASTAQGFVPGDAIAYMIHHTNLGVFDRDCMRAFLSKVTLYGIGTRVLLEDEREATVLRSIPGSPLEPIVVVGEPGAGETLDLTSANTQIVEPLVESGLARRTRMPKSRISQILWKDEAAASHQPNA